MSATSDLKAVFTETVPLVERWIDLRDEFAALRDAATAKGLDWGQIKALAKAHVEDAEAGETKRVARIIEKAEYASSYAEMLRLQPDVIEVDAELNAPNLNENNSFLRDGAEVAREAHNLEVAGSSPAPATSIDLEALVADIADENRHEEVDCGPAVGDEFPKIVLRGNGRDTWATSAAADDWQCPPPPDFLLRRAS